MKSCYSDEKVLIKTVKLYVHTKEGKKKKKGSFSKQNFIYLNVQFETLTNKGVVIIDEQLDATWWFVIF